MTALFAYGVLAVLAAGPITHTQGDTPMSGSFLSPDPGSEGDARGCFYALAAGVIILTVIYVGLNLQAIGR